MSTLDNINRARQIVTAASQLTWSLYANGDLSVDQHAGIAYGLDVADEGIKAVETLTAEREAAYTALANLTTQTSADYSALLTELAAAQAWIRDAPHRDDCALQYGSHCSCGKTTLTREKSTQ